MGDGSFGAPTKGDIVRTEGLDSWAGFGSYGRGVWLSLREVVNEFAHAPLNLIAEGVYRLDALHGWIVEFPVEVGLAGEVGADVAAAHGDDHGGRFGVFGWR